VVDHIRRGFLELFDDGLLTEVVVQLLACRHHRLLQRRLTELDIDRSAQRFEEFGISFFGDDANLLQQVHLVIRILEGITELQCEVLQTHHDRLVDVQPDGVFLDIDFSHDVAH
jgi:hypothetical protein